MNELTLFEYEGRNVRTIQDEHGNPWFIAKDVAEILGYATPHMAVAQHCKHPKLLKAHKTCGLNVPPRGMTIIPEGDVYRLVTRSRLPEAQRFEEFIMDTIVPKYRKGELVDKSYQIPQTYAEALLEAGRLAAELEKAQPKLDAFDTLMETSGTMSLRESLKVLGIGSTTGCRKLREAGMFYSKPHNNNIPKQHLVDAGYFEVYDYIPPHSPYMVTSTRVTARGQEFLYRFFKKQGMVAGKEKTKAVAKA